MFDSRERPALDTRFLKRGDSKERETSITSSFCYFGCLIDIALFPHQETLDRK